MQYKILHIEDSKTDADLIKRLLERSEIDFDYYWAENKESYLKGLCEFQPDVILSDHQMPQFDSKMAFEIYKEKNLDIPFILVTGTVSEEFAVMMMKSGLDDYLLKTNLQRLPQAIINAVSKRISDRKIKQVEAELKQSEANLRTIFENTVQAFILGDINGNVIELNNQANHFVNIAWEKNLEKNENLFNAIPLFRKENLKKHIDDVFLGKKIRFESDIEVHNYGSKHFDISVCPINDPAGKMTGFCITVDDITERKKNEEKLRQLSQAVEQSPASVIITDTKGNIQYVNSKFTMITGYDAEEVIGKNPRFLKSDYTPASEYARLWKNITSGTEWRGELLNKKKNGDFYWELALISPIIDAKGEIINFLAVKEDITERKKAEEEVLRKNQQLSLLSEHLQNIREEERSNIAREIHDELGQQLTVIKMDISMLQKELKGKPLFENGLCKLNHLVDQTIDTVRRLAFELRPSMLDDLGLYTTAHWYVKEFEKRTGVKVLMATDKKETSFDKKITTNVFRILQECLTNIARHAKATEVKIKFKTEDDHFSMSIQDDGKGFDTSVENKKTLGILGMQERTTIMQGTYSIESTPGKGTLVQVKVPLFKQSKKTEKI